MDFAQFLIEMDGFIDGSTGLAELGQAIQYAQRSIAVAVGLFTLIFGLIQCFFGFRLFKVVLAIISFVSIGAIGTAIGFATTFDGEAAFMIGAISGLLGAILSYRLYLLGVFVVVSFSGFIVGALLIQSIETGIIIGLVMGVVAIFLEKPIIILMTSISGGVLAGTSLATIVDAGSGFGMISGLIFVGLGIYFQFKSNTSSDELVETGSTKRESYSFNDSKAVVANKANNSEYSDKNNENSDISSRNSTEAETYNTELDMDSSSNAEKNKSTSHKEENWFSENYKKSITYLKDKIDSESEMVESGASRISKPGTLGYNLENIESMLFRNKIFKNIMPFVEYILASLILIMVFSSFSSTTLIIFFAVLTLVRKKYEYVIVSLFIFISMKTISLLLILGDASINIVFSAIVEIAVIGVILYASTSNYLKLDKGANLKEKVLKSYDSVKNSYIKTSKCTSCGMTNKNNAKYCNSCGSEINVDDNVSDEYKIEFKETSENNCIICGKNNKKQDLYCADCGKDLSCM